MIEINHGCGGKKRFILEPHSPYYLDPSKGPGVMITAVVFDGQNYDMWEKTVRTTLKAKNKLGFIDGTLARSKEQRDEEFTECHVWNMTNSMLFS